MHFSSGLCGPPLAASLVAGLYVLKRKAERMAFSVNAKDEKQAIERAIKEYDVPERERFRISVRREA